jgi:two-component system response regulator DevR
MSAKNAKIRIILASRPKILSDVIRSMIEHQPDMEVVGEVLDPIELLSTTRLVPADVVIITPLKVNGNPRICNHLLEEHPSLKIMIFSANGEAGLLVQMGVPTIRIDDPSEQAILSALRTVLR